MDYFGVFLTTTIIGLVASIVADVGGIVTFIAIVVLLVLAWIGLCASARRLHDLGHTGWLNLVFLVPLVNLGMTLYILFTPGQRQDNIYGPAEKSPDADTTLPATSTGRIAPQSLPPQVTRDIQVATLPASAESPEEDLWEAALKEVDGTQRRNGLWAKVFAQTNGDENKAKAAYISLRVEQLQEEQRLAREEKDRLAQAEQERLFEQRSQEERLAVKVGHMPKGLCPACRHIVILDAPTCPHCQAFLGEGSAWHATPLQRAFTDEDRNQAVTTLQSAGYQCNPHQHGTAVTVEGKTVAYAFSHEDLYGLSLLAQKKKPLSRWVDSLKDPQSPPLSINRKARSG